MVSVHKDVRVNMDVMMTLITIDEFACVIPALRGCGVADLAFSL